MEITVTELYNADGESVSEILTDSFDLFVKSAISEWPLISEVQPCIQK